MKSVLAIAPMVLVLAGCGAADQRLASPGGAEKVIVHHDGTGIWAEPRGRAVGFAIHRDDPAAVGTRRYSVVGKVPGNELPVSQAQLDAELRVLTRMVDKDEAR